MKEGGRRHRKVPLSSTPNTDSWEDSLEPHSQASAVLSSFFQGPVPPLGSLSKKAW